MIAPFASPYHHMLCQHYSYNPTTIRDPVPSIRYASTKHTLCQYHAYAMPVPVSYTHLRAHETEADL
eukprot:3040322-Rhodomonas_salina.1